MCIPLLLDASVKSRTMVLGSTPSAAAILRIAAVLLKVVGSRVTSYVITITEM